MRTLILLLVAVFSGSFLFFKNDNSKISLPSISNDIKPAEKGFAVLELFTSEGCSSCPSADELMQKYATRDNVFVLSYHVTYWNRLGWKDMFSQKTFDERQYSYGAKFKGDGVYTPQVVINGGYECVGSRGAEIEKQIQNVQAQTPTNSIALLQKTTGNDVEINYNITGDTKGKSLHLVLVETALFTNVKNGENSGRTLKHANVVRDFQTVKLNEIGNGVGHFFLLKDWQKNNCKIIGFLQDDTTWKISGASQVSI